MVLTYGYKLPQVEKPLGCLGNASAQLEVKHPEGLSAQAPGEPMGVAAARLPPAGAGGCVPGRRRGGHVGYAQSLRCEPALCAVPCRGAPSERAPDGAGRRPEAPLTAGARHRGEPGPALPAHLRRQTVPQPRALCGNVQK